MVWHHLPLPRARTQEPGISTCHHHQSAGRCHGQAGPAALTADLLAARCGAMPVPVTRCIRSSREADKARGGTVKTEVTSVMHGSVTM